MAKQRKQIQIQITALGILEPSEPWLDQAITEGRGTPCQKIKQYGVMSAFWDFESRYSSIRPSELL